MQANWLRWLKLRKYGSVTFLTYFDFQDERIPTVQDSNSFKQPESVRYWQQTIFHIIIMQKLFLLSAAVLGLLGTILGAFGAHALKAKLTPAMLSVYQTGVQYQFYHALALLLVAVLLFHIHNIWLNLSGLAYIAGVVLFSGSLYLLSITGIKWIGIITPIGGLSYILGWIFLIIAVIQFKG